MPWIQIKLQVNQPHTEQAENLLLELGAVSVTFTDAEDEPILEPAPGETPLWQHLVITGLFEADVDTQHITKQLESRVKTESRIIVEQLEDKDWVRAWMDHYQPMQFGKRLWICPRHLEPPQPDAINLMLDPGLAFGTGTHPTTALCLEWLDSAELQNKTILDFGCGSGVLAIAAALLGAGSCSATDIDEQALIATRDNADVNQVSGRIDIMTLDAFNQQQETYDLVLANILAQPLMTLAPDLAARCKSGGHIVLSGILATQADELARIYSQWFELDRIEQKEDWARITGTKKP